MITQYPNGLTPAIQGQSLAAPRRCKPMQLPLLAQIDDHTITGGTTTDDVTLRVLDRESGVTHQIVIPGNATEATLLASILAAVRANAQLNALFAVADAGTGANVIVRFTARHANRAYTISSVGGPSGPAVAGSTAVVQAPGGAGLTFGSLVARGDDDNSFASIGAATTLTQITGALWRDESLFQDIPAPLSVAVPNAVPLSVRGRHYPIAELIRMWVTVETAVTPASAVHVRRALTSGAGTVGSGFRATAAGVAQVATVTPGAGQNSVPLSIEIRILTGARAGQSKVLFHQSDASMTATEAADAFRADLAADVGFSSAVAGTGTATLILTAASADVTFTVDVIEGTFTVAEATTAGATHTIDVSSVAKFESSAPAGGLAVLAINLQP